ncbi:unnamed protein product [Gemmataceae bacterium]|nr:unnamed protein product [Gemmataceae bacterium]VTT97307.1 unnamed protein product [Gemmataceae bacterium]
MNPAPYRVVWKRSAIEIELAQAVITAIEQGHDPEAITHAMEEADQALALNPNNVGESRPAYERVARFSPLTIRFAVHDDELLVYVLSVVYAPPRRR